MSRCPVKVRATFAVATSHCRTSPSIAFSPDAAKSCAPSADHTSAFTVPRCPSNFFTATCDTGSTSSTTAPCAAATSFACGENASAFTPTRGAPFGATFGTSTIFFPISRCGGFAPASIHFANISTSAAVSFSRLPGGMNFFFPSFSTSPRRYFTSKLSADFPAFTAAPLSPPFKMSACFSITSLPSGSSAEWQSRQRSSISFATAGK